MVLGGGRGPEPQTSNPVSFIERDGYDGEPSNNVHIKECK